MKHNKQKAGEVSTDITRDTVNENEFAVRLKAKFKLNNGVMRMKEDGTLELIFTIVDAKNNIIVGTKEGIEITFEKYGKFQLDNKITVRGESFITLDQSELNPELTRLTSDRFDIQLEADGFKGDHGIADIVKAMIAEWKLRSPGLKGK